MKIKLEQVGSTFYKGPHVNNAIGVHHLFIVDKNSRNGQKIKKDLTNKTSWSIVGHEEKGHQIPLA